MYVYFAITPFNFCHSHLFNPKIYVSGIVLQMRVVARDRVGNTDSFHVSSTVLSSTELLTSFIILTISPQGGYDCFPFYIRES